MGGETKALNIWGVRERRPNHPEKIKSGTNATMKHKPGQSVKAELCQHRHWRLDVIPAEILTYRLLESWSTFINTEFLKNDYTSFINCFIIIMCWLLKSYIGHQRALAYKCLLIWALKSSRINLLWMFTALKTTTRQAQRATFLENQDESTGHKHISCMDFYRVSNQWVKCFGSIFGGRQKSWEQWPPETKDPSSN